MKKPLLPEIVPFNPNVLSPGLFDNASDIDYQALELEVMKLHSSIPDDKPEDFPFKMVDGIAIAHPCLCYISQGSDCSLGTLEEAEKLTATTLGYHKPSNSTALIMTDHDGMIKGIMLYGADGTRGLHGSADRFFKSNK
jgi:hypothetical protein